MGDYADGSPYGGHPGHRAIVQADEGTGGIMSDTPRTDAAHEDCALHAECMKLERELATATAYSASFAEQLAQAGKEFRDEQEVRAKSCEYAVLMREALEYVAGNLPAYTTPQYHIGDAKAYTIPGEVLRAVMENVREALEQRGSIETREAGEAASQAADGAIPSSRSKNPGWMLVPIEPTKAMLSAGSTAAAGFGTPWTRTENAYKAMVHAAPNYSGGEPPSQLTVCTDCGGTGSIPGGANRPSQPCPECKPENVPEGELTLTPRNADTLDAERYRYLRDVAGQVYFDEDGPMVCDGLGDNFDYLRGVEVDASIDKAMERWKAEGYPTPMKPTAFTDAKQTESVEGTR